MAKTIAKNNLDSTPEDSSARSPKSTKAVGGEDVTSPPTASVDVPLCRHEGVSFTKVSRGDRRLTFPNEPSGKGLFLRAIAQPLEFDAVAFFSAE